MAFCGALWRSVALCGRLRKKFKKEINSMLNFNVGVVGVVAGVVAFENFVVVIVVVVVVVFVFVVVVERTKHRPASWSCGLSKGEFCGVECFVCFTLF